MAGVIEVQGVDRLVANLNNIASNVPREAGAAAREEFEIEKKESMRRTPILTGALRASHQVLGPFYSHREINVRIEVGGPEAPYAVIVHEDEELDHPVGQAKFLESTLMESKAFIAKRIADRIDLSKTTR